MSGYINEILSASNENHEILMDRLNKKNSIYLLGKWVAVAKNKIFSDITSERVLKKANKVESNEDKILLVKIPLNNANSVRF